MSQKTGFGLTMLGAAALLGLLGAWRLRPLPLALGAALWGAALAAGLLAVAHRRQQSISAHSRWLVVMAAGFAGGLAWRDSAVLKGLDILCVLTLLSVAAIRSEAGRVHLAAVTEYFQAGLRAFLHSGIGAVLLISDDVSWKEVGVHGGGRGALGALRGVLLALPLLFIFGGLFAAADPAYAQLLHQVFRVDVNEGFTSVLFTLACAWAVAGFLRRFMVGGISAAFGPSVAWSSPFKLGGMELGVSLGLLNALFLSFVLVQLRWLFGGDALVRSPVALTYAEYARHGFFELTIVAALVLPLLLLIDWMQHPDTARTRLFQVLAGVLVALVAIIVVSAIQRMLMYHGAYGLTELRVYTTAFMAWLGVVFVWFCATVLRGRRERFAFGALVSALVATFGLHVLNPDALIVRENAARTGTRLGFDAEYAGGLSADAIPALVAVRERLGHVEASAAAEQLSAARDDLARTWGWREWSWSRDRARRAIQSLPPETLRRPAPVPTFRPMVGGWEQHNTDGTSDESAWTNGAVIVADGGITSNYF